MNEEEKNKDYKNRYVLLNVSGKDTFVEIPWDISNMDPNTDLSHLNLTDDELVDLKNTLFGGHRVKIGEGWIRTNIKNSDRARNLSPNRDELLKLEKQMNTYPIRPLRVYKGGEKRQPSSTPKPPPDITPRDLTEEESNPVIDALVEESEDKGLDEVLQKIHNKTYRHQEQKVLPDAFNKGLKERIIDIWKSKQKPKQPKQ
jgi:hypothetical protein